MKENRLQISKKIEHGVVVEAFCVHVFFNFEKISQ